MAVTKNVKYSVDEKLILRLVESNPETFYKFDELKKAYKMSFNIGFYDIFTILPNGTHEEVILDKAVQSVANLPPTDPVYKMGCEKLAAFIHVIYEIVTQSSQKPQGMAHTGTVSGKNTTVVTPKPKPIYPHNLDLVNASQVGYISGDSLRVIAVGTEFNVGCKVMDSSLPESKKFSSVVNVEVVFNNSNIYFAKDKGNPMVNKLTDMGFTIGAKKASINVLVPANSAESLRSREGKVINAILGGMDTPFIQTYLTNNKGILYD